MVLTWAVKGDLNNKCYAYVNQVGLNDGVDSLSALQLSFESGCEILIVEDESATALHLHQQLETFGNQRARDSSSFFIRFPNASNRASVTFVFSERR